MKIIASIILILPFCSCVKDDFSCIKESYMENSTSGNVDVRAYFNKELLFANNNVPTGFNLIKTKVIDKNKCNMPFTEFKGYDSIVVQKSNNSNYIYFVKSIDSSVITYKTYPSTLKNPFGGEFDQVKKVKKSKKEDNKEQYYFFITDKMFL